ncbi:MAG: hypothetical protein H6510_12660 [Acidobacteria bacterium]|nr:hypothetical protein [Acidobacteriota bacterium]MCB9398658.1 hypothetical protein [Acidobacteriota bacterium]
MILFFCLFAWSDEVVGMWDIHSDDGKPDKFLRSESPVFFSDGRLEVETPDKQVRIRFRIEGDRVFLKKHAEGFVTYEGSDRHLPVEVETTNIGDLSLQLTPGWVRDTDQDPSEEGMTFAFFMNDRTETFMMIVYFHDQIDQPKDQVFQSIVGGFVQSMTGSDQMSFKDVSQFHGFDHPAKVMDAEVEGEMAQFQAAWGHLEKGHLLILTGSSSKADPQDQHLLIGSIRVKGKPVIGP